MPVPDFVVALRERVGHDLLWMPGVTAVVRDEDGRVLLGRRADTGQWALPSGILEPGEQPATGLVREVEEETGVRVEVLRLDAVWTLPAITYPNGDHAQYLDLCFTCRPTGGEAHVADDESLEVGWFALDALPRRPRRAVPGAAHPGARAAHDHVVRGAPGRGARLRSAGRGRRPRRPGRAPPCAGGRRPGHRRAAHRRPARGAARARRRPRRVCRGVRPHRRGPERAARRRGRPGRGGRHPPAVVPAVAVARGSPARAGGGGAGRLEPARCRARAGDAPVGRRGVPGARVRGRAADDGQVPRSTRTGFYAGLGFTASHEGFKMALDTATTDPRSER